MSQRRISIRITKELEKRLAKAAKKAGKSESEIVRAALDSYCTEEEARPSAYDLFKRAGLIGDAKNLPSDLATNPKYMEGFGRG
ncbi:MAG TPA: ribbon-helix-helix protein, CopG family [Pirellulaceae bacterium]|nr:ribbon-helix-helix protein, CopG family [Pirellulaceae bacterium]